MTTPASTTAQDGSSANRSEVREHFIPLRKADLVQLLAQESGLSSADRQSFLHLCEMLDAVFHYEYHQRLEGLKDAYAFFDPDRVAKRIRELADDEREQQIDSLFEQFSELLERANYQHLTNDDISQILTVNSYWGVKLDVDLSVFQRLEVFARGNVTETRTARRWRRLWRKEEIEVSVFQRLVVIFRLTDHDRLPKHIRPEAVYIKIFKDIPRADLDMLLPGSRVKMSMFDRVRILVPAMSGVTVTLVKVVNALMAAVYVTFLGALAFVGLVVGTIGYGLKSFFGFLRTKQKYQFNLTRNLYFQNLDNNAGVLFRLLDDAEEQECREAILGYFFLSREANADGWTQQELDRRAEDYLRETIGVDVDFEVDDALKKLLRLGLVEAASDGRLRAVPITQGLVKLDAAWDGYFPYQQEVAD